MLWRQEIPERDADLCRQQNLALAHALGGDTTVVNPSRVLRLGGSIAWPAKPGRVLERTEFHLFDDDRPKVYVSGQLARAFPPQSATSSKPVEVTQDRADQPSAAKPELRIGSEFDGVSVEACLDRIRAGEHWHDNLVRLTGHWIARGWSDAEILTAAEGLTLAGYTIDQTRREVAQMIAGGRAKWSIPNPQHAVLDNPVPSPLRATPLAPLVFEEIPRRDWVVMRRLIRKFVTILFGAGGLNKSSFTMQEAVGVALGRCLNGEPFSVKQSGRVWIYNNEDPVDELRRRLAAICLNWHITPGDLQPRLFLDSGLDRRLIVMKQEHRIAVATPDADALAAEIQRNGIDLLIVDPFIRVHQVDENDNPAIDAVIEQFSRIASRCNCCISLVHHGRKTPPSAVKTTGNADNARGASALKDAVRLAHELTEMTERDAERLGVGDAERPWLIRLDDAKNNMSPPAESAIWFKRKGVLLPNGLPPLGADPDNVGVLEPWTPPDVRAPISRHACNQILDDIDLRWKAGNPYSANHQARGRYVVPRMVKEHGVPKASAEELLNSWFANGIVADEVFDTHRKATGLRVLRFIHD
jgi:hypothetical protein